MAAIQPPIGCSVCVPTLLWIAGARRAIGRHRQKHIKSTLPLQADSDLGGSSKELSRARKEMTAAEEVKRESSAPRGTNEVVEQAAAEYENFE